MKKLLTIVVIIAIAAAFLWAGLTKRYYRTISEESLAGVIRCVASRDKAHDFYLFYFPAPKEKQPGFKFLELKGNTWLFEGEIIKWKKPLNLIGIKTAHRPVRIYDEYGNSCALENGPGEKLAFKIGGLLPFVDTRFTSIVKQGFVPKVKFGIYATNSGYLVRKIR